MPNETPDSTNSQSNPDRQPGPVNRSSSRRGWLSQTWRLATKELKETLRDRRTIITLIAMPLLVYPLLSIAFRTFLLNNLNPPGEGKIVYAIAVKSPLSPEEFKATLGQWAQIVNFDTQKGNEESKSGAASRPKVAISSEKEAPPSSNDKPTAEAAPEATTNELKPPEDPEEAPLLEHKWAMVERPDATPKELLLAGQADLVLEVTNSSRRQRQTSDVVIHINDESANSRRAGRWLQGQLDKVNRVVLQTTVQRLGGDPRLAISTNQQRLTSGISSRAMSNQFAAIIPLVLVLMTITGAVYPAIDLTAGERERGTLETLVAAPIPRMRILVAKLIAVLTVAVLTASLNVIGMLTTIWTFRLDTMLIGDGGLTLGMMLKVFALLVLFAAFFSSVLLVVTSFARSFKEAQAYLIPIILLSLGPGLMALSPGLKLAGPMAVCPLLNILILARDVLQNDVQLVPAAVAIFSTVVYGLLALSLAASIFGTDNILYGSGSSWKELLAPPLTPSSRATPNLALFCLLLLFPVNFVLIGLLGRLELGITWRLVFTAAFTFVAFCLIPLIVARYQWVRTLPGFGLQRPAPIFFAAAILLGLSLWPIVMTAISGWHDLIGLISGTEASDSWRERIVAFSREQADLFRQAPAWLILIAFSLTPAFCEEFFFRGLLQRSLLTNRRPWQAILFSAFAFGAFHTLSGSVAAFDRLLPTALMGIILGWIAFKANSIWPSVILHMLHNAIVGFLAYYQPQLSKIPGFPGENEALPLWWSGVALIVAAIGLAILWRAPASAESTAPSPG
jgi:ABC-type Na+ efflux pump permease subunit/membrane protease YdiL (CAAX protease family)